MNKEILVSVVIAVYNGERFLKQTIESVLSQTYKNLEVIIVDDASTDGSRDIIDSFDDNRIVRFYKTKNEHVCCASNEGFKRAKGDYCAYICHDDVWEPEKIEQQLRFMEEHLEYGACFTHCNIINQDNEIINSASQLFQIFNKFGNADRYEKIKSLFLDSNQLCSSSVLVRKEVLEKTGYYNYALVQTQDYELWMRFLLETDIYILEKKLTSYREILDTKANLSTLTPTKYVRFRQENAYLKDCYLHRMNDEDFKETFREVFLYTHADSHKELLCERMMLLKRMKNPYWNRRAIDLLQVEDCRCLLESVYNYGVQEYYKENTVPIFWEFVKTEYEQMQEMLGSYEKVVSMQQDVIEKLENRIKELEANF